MYTRKIAGKIDLEEIKSLYLGILSLRCLFNIKMEISNRQLDIKVWLGRKKPWLEITFGSH